MSPNESENLSEVHLQDVTEGELLEENLPRNARKKKLLMVGGIFVLLLVTAVGGYFLLSGKEVNVKAARKITDRVTNGKDLQQAAYDSLRGSLSNDATPSPSNTPATNIGAGQPVIVAMAGVTPTASPGNTAKAPAPIQSGIAMTIAPPPEAATHAPKETITTPPVKSAVQSSESKSVATDTITVSKPRTDASIVFARVSDKNNTERNEQVASNSAAPINATLPALNKATPLPLRIRTTPSFGTMLPVRLLGALYTLRVGVLARLELLRDSQTEHWQLPRGTIFIGAVQGAGMDRAYVQIKGFLDPSTDHFTKLEGEILGSDGGAGLRGKERRLSSVWLRVLDRAAQTGTQIFTSILGRNNSQVVVATDPYGTYRAATGNDQTQLQNSRSFVEVPAGTVGFVLVTSLPAAQQTDATLASAPRLEQQNQSELSDAELAELFASADPVRIRAALPRMNLELRRITELTLKEMEH